MFIDFVEAWPEMLEAYKAGTSPVTQPVPEVE